MRVPMGVAAVLLGAALVACSTAEDGSCVHVDEIRLGVDHPLTDGAVDAASIDCDAYCADARSGLVQPPEKSWCRLEQDGVAFSCWQSGTFCGP